MSDRNKVALSGPCPIEGVPDRSCAMCKNAGPAADNSVLCEWPKRHTPPWFASFLLAGSGTSQWQYALEETACPCFEAMTKQEMEGALTDADKAALDALGTPEELIKNITSVAVCGECGRPLSPISRNHNTVYVACVNPSCLCGVERSKLV